MQVGVVGQRVARAHQDVPAELVLEGGQAVDLRQHEEDHKGHDDALQPIRLNFDQHFCTNSRCVPQVSIVVDYCEEKDSGAGRQTQKPPTGFLEEHVVEAFLARVATCRESCVFEALSVHLQTQVVVFIAREEPSHFDFIY